MTQQPPPEFPPNESQHPAPPPVYPQPSYDRYPQYQYAQQGPPPAPPTNTLAIIAFIGAFFVSLVGIICGHIALKQIRTSGEGGRGLALAGLIIGYIGFAVGFLIAAAYVLLIIGLVASGA